MTTILHISVFWGRFRVNDAKTLLTSETLGSELTFLAVIHSNDEKLHTLKRTQQAQ